SAKMEQTRARKQNIRQDPGDAAQQEAKHREAEMRNSILTQVLDQLSNLALVKPEKTKAVENYLIHMARYGQLRRLSQQTEKTTTVKFNRRKVMDSDEEDDY
uniref:Programmed cell death 5 n=1 Tax=Gorilla gorilla gorilla TaxID=9595 RepID=A0A2I2ZBH7_GORGO